MAAAADRHLDELQGDAGADRRNGYYRRNLLTESGDIECGALPRSLSSRMFVQQLQCAFQIAIGTLVRLAQALPEEAYHANDFGMMGNERDGHSFILIGPDGKIEWRADYGGAPDYTMYIPAEALIADIYNGVKSRAK